MPDPSDSIPRTLFRPTVPVLDAMLGDTISVLDKGFIRVIDYMGDEAAILQAARVSYGVGTKTKSSDRGLLRYLMRHHHSTPFEMCEIKLHVKLPVFVARQWIRHRTANVNEYSARYSILSREFHVPAAEDIASQSTTNAQGRSDVDYAGRAEDVLGIMRGAMGDSFDVYEALLDEDPEKGYGVARETAREVLPMSTYTEWYWKIDLHNLLNFLRLRMDPHAQKEIRDYADEIGKLVEKWMPNVWEAFNDYVLGAHTFSAIEMKVLRRALEKVSNVVLTSHTGMSDREVAAFNKALGMGGQKSG